MASNLKIKANFTESQIRGDVERAVEAYLKDVITVYSNAGRAMVEDARGRTKDFSSYGAGSFGNITWNLRSSIGCAVYRDGVKVFSYFPVLNTGAEGAKTGSDYADELSQGRKGIVLIVVAGMHYARAVESRGYNVIDATAIMAEEILEKYILSA